MRRRLLPLVAGLVAVLSLGACESPGGPVQFWRPISEPNLLMSSDKLQRKLSFDLGQCHCGIYPADATRDNIVEFQPDKQRLAQTSVTVTPNDDGQCQQKPSLVVSECMRERGWEQTNCSGRMPLAGGGSLCAAYVQPE